MCLCIPSFPFRNTIIIDKNGDDNKEAPIPVRAFFPPQQTVKTWRPFTIVPFFPHHNYVHVRDTARITSDEIPAPPVFNGTGFSACVLRNRFLNQKSFEEVQNQPHLLDEKDERVNEVKKVWATT